VYTYPLFISPYLCIDATVGLSPPENVVLYGMLTLSYPENIQAGASAVIYTEYEFASPPWAECRNRSDHKTVPGIYYFDLLEPTILTLETN
jgi:hypothetical protein